MSNSKLKQALSRQYKHLDVHTDSEQRAVWVRMRNQGRPCMSTELLQDLVRTQTVISEAAHHDHENSSPERLAYQVLVSDRAGVFNLGGDLEYFLQLIEEGDRDRLYHYGKQCIDVIYRSTTAYNLPFTTIALVQGQALGGGFEAALSNTVLVAEEGATFGFPETLFGLFPGMGALSLLSRRVAPGLAKRLISSGRLYPAQELYDLGVIDILARDGEGEQAVCDYIAGRRSRESGFYALDRAAARINPVSYDELIEVVRIWVDTALELSPRNRRLMRYLLQAQRRRWEEGDTESVEKELAVM